MRNCFRNISRALAEAGATLDDLVRVLIFVTSQPEFERIMPIIRKHCYAARPANTAVFARLVAPHMNVEIEAMARKRRWLFTGDLYLAPKLRYLRADEDIYAMLDSLRRVSALEPDLVFCQHRGRVEDGTAMLRRKLDFLVQLGERVHDLHAKGLDHDEIASALPWRDLLWRMWTAGHFSKGHFVSAFLRPDVPLHVQTPK